MYNLDRINAKLWVETIERQRDSGFVSDNDAPLTV